MLAQLVHSPPNCPVTTHEIATIDENRAGVLITRLRSCVSMQEPLEKVIQTAEEVLRGYPDLEWWAVRTEYNHGISYLRECIAKCAANAALRAA